MRKRLAVLHTANKDREIARDKEGKENMVRVFSRVSDCYHMRPVKVAKEDPHVTEVISLLTLFSTVRVSDPLKESAGIATTVRSVGAAMNSIAILATTYGVYASEEGLASIDATERLEKAAKIVEGTAQDTETLRRLIEAVKEFQGVDAVKQLVFALSRLTPVLRASC